MLAITTRTFGDVRSQQLRDAVEIIVVVITPVFYVGKCEFVSVSREHTHERCFIEISRRIVECRPSIRDVFECFVNRRV
ncbi:hypothetical protein K933_17262 [Candidatus Halobonum tyrrellensis G22]|uniref:Uncharacterized protein n=1 Tax=Candidatus Halobonum tyrrellensis G22 TaxID=1324957 RepID=V4HGD7_9EURY|nr:hypothetical protein K933_17262 [Candidatus Halobonum tyrrellensis G22]